MPKKTVSPLPPQSVERASLAYGAKQLCGRSQLSATQTLPAGSMAMSVNSCMPPDIGARSRCDYSKEMFHGVRRLRRSDSDQMLEMFAFKVGDRDVAKYERPVLAMLGSVRRHALGRAERRYRRFVEFAKPRVAIWGWPRSRRWGRLRSNIHRCGLAATFNLEA